MIRPAGASRALVIAALLGLAQVSAAQDSAGETPAGPSPLTFPRSIKGEAGTVVIHLPQVDAWEDYAKLSARSAVEVTPAGESAPVIGIVEFSADTDINLELRVVAVENTEILATHFTDVDAARSGALDAILREVVQPQPQLVPLDAMLTAVAMEISVPPEEGLSYDPPPIFYSTLPAVLVNIDGEPILADIPDTRLRYAVNTNWDLFRYRDREWYLRYERRWLKNDELTGEWTWDDRLPGDFDKLPDDGNWADTKAAIPPQKDDAIEPVVFVSQRPGELIVTDGQPQHRTVGGEGLEYVQDTDSDVFRYEHRYYYLVSGRWFVSNTLRGPWEPAGTLPDAFASIPPDHEKAHVLAAVPGTEEAQIAVIEASLPRTATIDRDAGRNISVFYEGEPVFETVPGTDVQRAVNSPNDVLLVEGTYYLCDSAVWYVSTTADGPWVVADDIPAAIYAIPPSSPVYYVTNVIVEDSDDETVTTSYDSGYYGVTFGLTLMYGTGWYYPPYWGYYPGYPYYYPYPHAYGASSWYNPNTGMFGRSQSVYGPYGGYGRAASYNPETGAYARGRAVWDSNEIAGSAIGYNPRTGTGVATNRYRNEYGGYGESLVTQGDQWLATRSQWDQDSLSSQFRTSGGTTGEIERQREGDVVYGTGEFERGDQSLQTKSARGEQGTLIGYETGSGEQGVIGRDENGDLYAGKDGNVYRRDENGWSQHGEDGWEPVEVPDEAAARLDERRGGGEAASLPDRRDGNAFDAASGDRARASPNERGFAGNAPGISSLDAGSLQQRSFNTPQRMDLDRSYNARTSGYQRYNTRQSGAMARPRSMPRRMR